MIRRYLMVLLFLLTTPVFAQDQAATTTYTIRRGDTLYNIAIHFGVSTQAIIEANSIANPSHIAAGQVLTIPNFDSTPAIVENPLVAGTPITHIVKSGETLKSIANQYGMTIQQIAQINHIINTDLIYRGQELTVWENVPTQDPAAPTAEVAVEQPIAAETTAPEAATPAEPASAPAPVSQITYIVQPGEGLAGIGRQFQVDWTLIAQINNISDPNTIYSGQELLIPVDTPTDPNAPRTHEGFLIPTPTISVGKQVVVDLSDQMLYAFQDGVLLRSSRVSTGLPGSPTVLGDYNVYVKYPAQTMSGPGYYLTDVPYVMYFYQGYGLHGTYWHNNFGHPMSHGCVNLPTPESEWLYNNFVEVGTPVHVQI